MNNAARTNIARIDRVVNTRMTEETYSRLALIAEGEERSVSFMVRRAVGEMIKRHETESAGEAA